MQTRGIGSFTHTTASPSSFSGKLTNFSPNSLIVSISKSSGALTDAELGKFTMSVQFKNRLGKNAVILNNVPLDVIAKMSDYEGGFSCNSTDIRGAFRIGLGKIILTGQDEISVTINCGSDAPTCTGLVYGVDESVGKEIINIYEYASGVAGMQLTFPNALIGFMDIASPSEALNVRTSDYFDDNLITELEIVCNGACLGNAENFDNFGKFWEDKSGYSQQLGVTCGSANERVLVREWFYDVNRIGVSQ